MTAVVRLVALCIATLGVVTLPAVLADCGSGMARLIYGIVGSAETPPTTTVTT